MQYYGQVYSIEFAQEDVSRAADSTAVLARRDRGRLIIAVSFPKEMESKFEDSLRAQFEKLGVAEFGRPWAGLKTGSGPLDQPILEKSSAVVWVCHDIAGDYRADLLFNETTTVWSRSRSGHDGRFTLDR